MYSFVHTPLTEPILKYFGPNDSFEANSDILFIYSLPIVVCPSPLLVIIAALGRSKLYVQEKLGHLREPRSEEDRVRPHPVCAFFSDESGNPKLKASGNG
jgi:hypothetical protein